MKKYKYIKYLLFFLFFLLCLIIFGYNDADIMWNYGMAHAIRIGEIPYKDFNIISTPLYAFIMSLGLFISDTYIMFLIEQSILCTIFIYLLEKYLGEKYILLFIAICFPIFIFIFPTYNFLVALIVLLLLIFEKEEKPDWQIGILLGLLFLTKHTVGGVFILLSVISTLNIKKGLTRILYTIIPCLVFLLYLLITKSLYSFIDLSILGLFDFGKNNKSISIVLMTLCLIVFIYTIYSFFKYKKDYKNFYLLAALSFVIPMVDLMHTTSYIIMFLIVLLSRIKIKHNIKQLIIPTLSIVLSIFIMNVIYHYNYYKGVVLNTNLVREKGLLLDQEGKDYVHKVLKKYKSYKNSHIISMESMFFDIESGKKITYFDVPLHGNLGYDGIAKLEKNISKMHNHYFLIRDNKNGQFINEVNDYIRKNGVFIEEYESYEIYKIK